MILLQQIHTANNMLNTKKGSNVWKNVINAFQLCAFPSRGLIHAYTLSGTFCGMEQFQLYALPDTIMTHILYALAHPKLIQ